MICFRNARIIDSDCTLCKQEAEVFNRWRAVGGVMPKRICQTDHRPLCIECDEPTDNLKIKKCNDCCRRM